MESPYKDSWPDVCVSLSLSRSVCVQCARLQGRCHQQGAELKRREQQIQRMREKLSQLTDRHKPRGVCETVWLMLIHYHYCSQCWGETTGM